MESKLFILIFILILATLIPVWLLFPPTSASIISLTIVVAYITGGLIYEKSLAKDTTASASNIGDGSETGAALIDAANQELIDIKNKLEETASSAGLNSELIIEGILKSKCAYSTIPCSSPYIDDGKGCCIVNPDSGLSKSELNFIIAAPILQEIAITYVAENLIEYGLKYTGTKLIGPVAARALASESALVAAQKGLTSATASGSDDAILAATQKFAAAQIERLAATAAQRTALQLTDDVVIITTGLVAKQIGAKVGGFFLKFAKVLSNPAVLLAQLALMILDIFDPAGYSAYVSNNMQQLIKNLQSVEMEKMVIESGLTYPLLMPIAYIFPDSAANIILALMPEFTPAAMDILGTTEAGQALLGKMFLLELDPTTPELTAEDNVVFIEAVNVAMNKDFVKRDDLILKYLLESLPDNRKDFVKLYPAYSSETTFGVSLTKKGVEYWNLLNREKWLSNDENAPFVALWTNSYDILNQDSPGTPSKPNIITVKLDEYTPLVFPYQPLFQNCEGSLVGGLIPGAKTTVYPYQYGVTFNNETGLCNMTRDWCSTMGQTFDSSGPTNCKQSRDDKNAELIFGATLIRGPRQIAETIAHSYTRIGGRMPDGPCRDTEELSMGFCYKKCDPGYTGSGPVCWQDCPDEFRNDGPYCAKPGAYGRGGGYPWRGSDGTNLDKARARCLKDNPDWCEKYGAMYYPKCKPGFSNAGSNLCSPNCPAGMENIGVSCMKKSDTRKPKLEQCTGTMYLEGMSCYEPCKDRYYAMGAMCYPCTGLEVTAAQKEKCRISSPTISAGDAYAQQLVVNLDPTAEKPLKNFDLMTGKMPKNITTLNSDNFISVDENEGYDTANDIRIFRQGSKNLKRIISKSEANITKYCKTKCSDDSLCRAIFISGSSSFKRPCTSFAGYTEVGCGTDKQVTQEGEYNCYLLKSADPTNFENHGIPINGQNGVRSFGNPIRTQTIATFIKQSKDKRCHAGVSYKQSATASKVYTSHCKKYVPKDGSEIYYSSDVDATIRTEFKIKAADSISTEQRDEFLVRMNPDITYSRGGAGYCNSMGPSDQRYDCTYKITPPLPGTTGPSTGECCLSDSMVLT